jgi:hypothetical protein
MATSGIHFVVEEAPEGDYIARAINESIFAEADDIPVLHARVRNAVRCHFDDSAAPGVIRQHFT